jgi:hypothetical protein
MRLRHHQVNSTDCQTTLKTTYEDPIPKGTANLREGVRGLHRRQIIIGMIKNGFSTEQISEQLGVVASFVEMVRAEIENIIK